MIYDGISQNRIQFMDKKIRKYRFFNGYVDCIDENYLIKEVLCHK